MRQSGPHLIEKWHVVLAAAVVLAGLLVFYVVLPRSRLDRRLGALRAAGYPTSFAELAQYNKLPEGTPNAAPVYERAFAAFVPPVNEANVPFLGKAELPDTRTTFSEPVAKAVSQCLTANQDCLSLLHEAAGIKDCRYEWDYADPVNDVPRYNVPQQKRLISCARLLRLRTAADVDAGAVDSALTHIRDGLQLGRSLCREPGVMNYLLRIACYGTALDGLERTLSTLALPDEELAGLGETISSADATLNFWEAVGTEQCFTIELLRYPARHRPFGPVGAYLQILSDRGLASALENASIAMDATKLPSVQRLAEFREMSDEVDERMSSFHLDFLGTVEILPICRCAELDARISAHFDLARTALAIERYRLATGKIPERLEELVPQYLRAVPTDPFDGQPIR